MINLETLIQIIKDSSVEIEFQTDIPNQTIFYGGNPVTTYKTKNMNVICSSKLLDQLEEYRPINYESH